MKKGFLILSALALAFALTGCGNNSVAPSGNTPSVSSSNNTSDVSNTSSSVSSSMSASDISADETVQLLADISVEMEVDTAMRQAIVTISNGTSMTFSGYVHVRFFSAADKQVGSDIIFAEDVPAGNQTYARISIEETTNITMRYDISKPVFVEGPSSDGGTIDEAASADLSTAFENGFGGAGNPEWATSWYGYVTNIEVYKTDVDTYAVITVSAEADTESVDRIGNTIFANYSKDHNLSRVLVVDEGGDTLFNRST